MVRAELLWAGAELWTLEMHVCDVRVGERARLCGRSGRTGVSGSEQLLVCLPCPGCVGLIWDWRAYESGSWCQPSLLCYPTLY